MCRKSGGKEGKKKEIEEREKDFSHALSTAFPRQS